MATQQPNTSSIRPPRRLLGANLSRTIRLCSLLLGLQAAAAMGANLTAPRVHDEWDRIDRVVVSTVFNKRTQRHEANPMTFFTAAMANRGGIKIVVSTHDEAYQAEFLKLLMSMTLNEDGRPVIANASDVIFVNNLMPSDWARDHTPIVVFADSNVGVLLGFNTFPTIAGSTQSVANLAREIRCPFYRTLAPVYFPRSDCAPELRGRKLDDGRPWYGLGDDY